MTNKELGRARRLREIAASEKQQVKALVSHLAQAEGGRNSILRKGHQMKHGASRRLQEGVGPIRIKRFESARHGEPLSIVGYHHTTSKTFSLQPTRVFYFSDEPKSWESPWVPNCSLVVALITLLNPYVVLKSDRPYEGAYTVQSILRVKKAGFDGIIYTPSTEVQGKSYRQGVAFFPNDSVRLQKVLKL